MSQLRISSRMYRCTYDNQRLEEITDYLLSGSVTMDPGRDVTWTLDAEITPEGWDQLKPYRDWVAPWLTVEYPDGSVREGQLGLYLVLDSPQRHDEITGAVQLEAMDALWLLNAQGLGANLRAAKDVNKRDLVMQLLDYAVLTETGRGANLYTIPKLEHDNPRRDAKFAKTMEWPAYTSRLQAINDILRGAGAYSLWATRTGRLTTRERGREKLSQRAAVRTYYANLPEGVRVRRGQEAPGGLMSEVVGTVVTTPRSVDLMNEIVVVGSDPPPETDDADGGRKKRGKHRISHPDNKRSKDVTAGRKGRATRRYPVLDDDATAARVAKALAEELSTRNVTATVTVLPDPSLDLTHETVNLLIYRPDGRKVAGGQYAVHSVRYGFTPDDGVMELELGRIDDAGDVIGR